MRNINHKQLTLFTGELKMRLKIIFSKIISTAIKLFFLSTIGVISASAIANEYNPATLKIALLPDENAATIIQDNAPFAAFLEKSLNKKIKLIVTTDYSSMIEAARFGRIDIAYFGPASYTIAKDKMKGGKIDLEPFAARLKGGSTKYQSVVIANVKVKANKISELPTQAKTENKTLVEAIRIPETNIALISPIRTANNPPSKVKVTVVIQPIPFE